MQDHSLFQNAFQSIKRQIASKKFWLVALLATASIGGAAWYLRPTENPQVLQSQKAVQDTLVLSVTATGNVATSNTKTVETQVGGVVTKLFVENGDTVQQGDPLFNMALDDSSQQSYSQAVASYQSAKTTLASVQSSVYSLQASMYNKWDTFKTLAESDTYSDTSSDSRNVAEFRSAENEWLAAEAQVKNQSSSLSQAQTALNAAAKSLRLSSPTVYAPISGTVGGLSLQQGSVIEQSGDSDVASNQVAYITTGARPSITVNLTEADVSVIAEGNQATITLDALDERSLTGTVLSVDRLGTTNSGVVSYPATIVLDEMSPDVLPNMSAEVKIVYETKENAILIPSTAVQTKNNLSFVKILENGTVKDQPVTVGSSSDSFTEILSGITAGQEVITSGTKSTKASSNTTSPFSSFSQPGGSMRMPR